MSSAQYKYILRDAWNIAIKNKVLWIWAIFASLISFEGIYETVAAQFVQVQLPEVFYLQLLNTYQSKFTIWAENIRLLNLLSGDISAFIVAIFIVVLFLIGIWIVLVSQIVLISSAASIYRKRKVDLTDLFHQATEKFWQVLGINILARLVIYLGFILLSLPLLYSLLTSVSAVTYIANLIFFALFVTFSVIIGFLSIYAINFVIINDVHFSDAIEEAWNLFKKNKVLSLEVALMLFVVKILSVIFIFAIGFIIGMPLIAFILLSLVNNSALGVGVGIILIVLLISVVIIVINAVFTTFYLSSWTITFIEMTRKNVVSKLHRLVQQLTEKFVSKSKNYIDTVDTKKLEAKLQPYAEKAMLQAKKEVGTANKLMKKNYVKLEPIFKRELKKMIKQAKAVARKQVSLHLPKVSQPIKKRKPTAEKEVPKRTIKAKSKTAPKKRRSTQNLKQRTTKRKASKQTSAKGGPASGGKKAPVRGKR